MIWADGPALLVPPSHPWMTFALYLVTVLAVICVCVAVFLTFWTRFRNGHWPWTFCPACESTRRTKKARRALAKRNRRKPKPRVWEDLER
jgi:hypothetical protein